MGGGRNSVNKEDISVLCTIKIYSFPPSCLFATAAVHHFWLLCYCIESYLTGENSFSSLLLKPNPFQMQANGLNDAKHPNP